MRNNKSIQPLHVLACMLIFVCFSLGNVSWLQADNLEQNKKRLEGMSYSEKQQIRKNMTRYQRMNSEERKQVQQMHQAISENASLTEMFAVYRAWLNRLSPWQRDAIAKAKNTNERIDLVRKFLDEKRKEEKDQQEFDQLLNGSSEPTSEEKKKQLENLPEQLAKVLQPLREKMNLTEEENQGLDILDQQDRNVRVLRMAIERQTQTGPMVSESPESIFTPEIILEMIRKHPDEKFKSRLRNEDRSRRQIELLGRSLFDSMQRYYMDKKQNPPSEEQLRDTFADLDDHVKASMNNKSRNKRDLKRILTAYWLNPDLGELFRLVNFSKPGRRFKGRRGSGPPGSERRPERQRPPKPRPDPPPQ